ncbi:hypothetical protein [Pseudoflavonifractor sp. An85]|uniref:hypothetical protein n=1 Tax=Pseudoflavonifractor sp. An85 TaxID=1965661 RepID=UPI0013021EB4|nr:hypothetical protein [Pseudoflavonifractor sp. An85]
MVIHYSLATSQLCGISSPYRLAAPHRTELLIGVQENDTILVNRWGRCAVSPFWLFLHGRFVLYGRNFFRRFFRLDCLRFWLYVLHNLRLEGF